MNKFLVILHRYIYKHAMTNTRFKKKVKKIYMSDKIIIIKKKKVKKNQSSVKFVFGWLHKDVTCL